MALLGPPPESGGPATGSLASAQLLWCAQVDCKATDSCARRLSAAMSLRLTKQIEAAGIDSEALCGFGASSRQAPGRTSSGRDPRCARRGADFRDHVLRHTHSGSAAGECATPLARPRATPAGVPADFWDAAACLRESANVRPGKETRPPRPGERLDGGWVDLRLGGGGPSRGVRVEILTTSPSASARQTAWRRRPDHYLACQHRRRLQERHAALGNSARAAALRCSAWQR